MSNVDSYGHAVQQPQFGSIPLKSGQQQVIPRFFTVLKETDQIDPTTGLKVFREVEYLELLIPGDKSSSPVRRVNAELRSLHAEAYRRFKERGAQADMIGDGIPLKLWPGIRTELALALEQVNIFTVQQLAALADSRCNAPGTIGLRAERDKARSFLDATATSAPLAAMQKQIDDMKAQSALRDKQLEDALATASALQAQVNAQGGAGGGEQMPELTTPRGKNKDR